MTKNILTQDAIAALVAKDKQTKAKKVATGGKRQKKDLTEPRTYSVWFKQYHAFGTCSNPDCGDDREGGGYGGSAMVAVVKEHTMCRYCFLHGWHSDIGPGVEE